MTQRSEKSQVGSIPRTVKKLLHRFVHPSFKVNSSNQLVPVGSAIIQYSFGKLSQLESLPIDIVNCITSFLPSSSAALLSLCSKSLLKSIGTSHFSELQKGQSEELEAWDYKSIPSLAPLQATRQDFLLLLEKDIPDEIFCFLCQKIHNPSLSAQLAQRTTNSNKGIPCSTCIRTPSIYGSYTFNYSTIYHLMKLHRLNLPIESALKVLSTTATQYHNTYTYQRILTPLIISNEFFLKTKHRILLRRPSLPESEFLIWKLCHHTSVSHHGFSTTLGKEIKCRLSHLNLYPHQQRQQRRECKICEGVKQCKHCGTEYEIQVEKGREGRGWVLLVTCWQEFGEIRTLFDERWWGKFAGGGWRGKVGEVGAIMASMEGDDGRVSEEDEAELYGGFDGLEELPPRLGSLGL